MALMGCAACSMSSPRNWREQWRFWVSAQSTSWIDRFWPDPAHPAVAE
jgi:hypothetical protein